VRRHTHGGYGMFPGGDPRRFHPDSVDFDSGNRPEELAAHEAACKRWNEAEAAGKPLPPAEEGSCKPFTLERDGEVVGGGIVCGSAFGMGGYEFDIEFADDETCGWCGGDGEEPKPIDWDALVDGAEELPF
jgi:hypothetical protein